MRAFTQRAEDGGEGRTVNGAGGFAGISHSAGDPSKRLPDSRTVRRGMLALATVWSNRANGPRDLLALVTVWPIPANASALFANRTNDRRDLLGSATVWPNRASARQDLPDTRTVRNPPACPRFSEKQPLGCLEHPRGCSHEPLLLMRVGISQSNA